MQIPNEMQKFVLKYGRVLMNCQQTYLYNALTQDRFTLGRSGESHINTLYFSCIFLFTEVLGIIKTLMYINIINIIVSQSNYIFSYSLWIKRFGKC